MVNMRTIMPSLQRAKPAKVGAEGVTFSRVSLPSQRRDTKVVKNLSADEIAKEIVAWIRG
jgi:electron transfer flavoprotein beta subunit